MLEKIKLIEDKVASLVTEFNTKSDNLNKIVSDIGKYQGAKDVMTNDLHAIKGAIDAYQSTIAFLKGETPDSSPVTIEGQATSG